MIWGVKQRQRRWDVSDAGRACRHILGKPQAGLASLAMTACPAAKPTVCGATRRGHRTRGSDRAGGFPTMAPYRAGPGRSSSCMRCTAGTPASRGHRPIAVRPVGSSVPLACRSDGSGTASSRWHDHAKPCSPRYRAAVLRSSASSRRAAQVRGGRCRLSSGMGSSRSMPSI